MKQPVGSPLPVQPQVAEQEGPELKLPEAQALSQLRIGLLDVRENCGDAKGDPSTLGGNHALLTKQEPVVLQIKGMDPLSTTR